MSKPQIIRTSMSNFVRTARMAAREKGNPYELIEIVAQPARRANCIQAEICA